MARVYGPLREHEISLMSSPEPMLRLFRQTIQRRQTAEACMRQVHNNLAAERRYIADLRSRQWRARLRGPIELRRIEEEAEAAGYRNVLR